MTQHYSRRQILTLGTGVVALGSVIALWSDVADAQEKVSKAMIQYRESPKGGHECSNSLAPKSRKVVRGEISPHGWCAIWTPK